MNNTKQRLPLRRINDRRNVERAQIIYEKATVNVKWSTEGKCSGELIAKHSKPFTDDDVIKQSLITAGEIVGTKTLKVFFIEKRYWFSRQFRFSDQSNIINFVLTALESEYLSEYQGTLVILIQDYQTNLGFEKRNMLIFRNKISRRKF